MPLVEKLNIVQTRRPDFEVDPCDDVASGVPARIGEHGRNWSPRLD